MAKKKAIMRKVLTCFIVFAILMGVMQVSGFAMNSSNNATEASNHSNDLEKSFILPLVSNDTRETVSALSCNVYIKIDDDTCVGYEVYVDGVYQFTEGQSGTPDGYCAFYVSTGTHKFELRKNGCTTSKSWYCHCGTVYRWVSMPDYWCECGGDGNCKYPPTVKFDKSKYYEGDTVHATVSTIHNSIYYEIKDCSGMVRESGYVSNGETISYTIPSSASECCYWDICFYWNERDYPDLGSINALDIHLHECSRCYTFEVCPKTTCKVWVEVIDKYCKGYEVYVDGVYQFTEGQDGTPDGYCRFHVTQGTHKFELRKNGCSVSKSWYCQCGTDYSWVSMNDMDPHWCECNKPQEVKFKGTVIDIPSEGFSGGYWWNVKVDKWITGSLPCDTVHAYYVLYADAILGHYDRVQKGDEVEVYGSVDPNEKCYINLNGESYYIKKIETCGKILDYTINDGTYPPGQIVRATMLYKSLMSTPADFKGVFKVRSPTGEIYSNSKKERTPAGREDSFGYYGDGDVLDRRIPEDASTGWYDAKLELRNYHTDELCEETEWMENQFRVEEIQEIKFVATAIERCDVVAGADYWIVTIDEILSGPTLISGNVTVYIMDIFADSPIWGYADPNITVGDKVEVYGRLKVIQLGQYYVTLNGCEDYYIKRTDAPGLNEVKFRGFILVDHLIISFYSFDIQIDEILNDPNSNLQIGETVNVYGHRDGPAHVDNVTVGDRAEVFGEYQGYVGTYERIFLSEYLDNSSDHYVKKLLPANGSINITSISPPIGTTLIAGYSVTFTVTVDYDLEQSDYGKIRLSVNQYTTGTTDKEYSIGTFSPHSGSYTFTHTETIGDDWENIYVSVSLYAAKQGEPLPAEYTDFDYKHYPVGGKGGGSLLQFDLDYKGTEPASGNGDGNDQHQIYAQTGQSFVMHMFYKEGNAGNQYIIRSYPEWDQNSFILNSDNDESISELAQEMGGHRYDVENYIIPSVPGEYKIKVVYSSSITPPTWDNYNRLLGEFTVIVEGGGDCFETVPSDHWKGEYYNNKNLEGSPLMVRDDGTGYLNFDWDVSSPSTSCGIGSDFFSVRWTRTLNFDSGTWRFTATTDDGMRVYVDGSLVIDKWFNQVATTYTADVDLTAGTHTIKVEYYEYDLTAVAKLSWEKGSGPGDLELILFDPEVDGLHVKINGVVYNAIKPLHWDWGDGTQEESWFAGEHTYSTGGSYTVTVTAYGEGNAEVTKTVIVKVSPPSSGCGEILDYTISDGTYPPGQIVRATMLYKSLMSTPADFKGVFKVRSPTGEIYSNSKKERTPAGREGSFGYYGDGDVLDRRIPEDASTGWYDAKLELRNYHTDELCDETKWMANQFKIGDTSGTCINFDELSQGDITGQTLHYDQVDFVAEGEPPYGHVSVTSFAHSSPNGIGLFAGGSVTANFETPVSRVSLWLGNWAGGTKITLFASDGELLEDVSPAIGDFTYYEFS